MSHFLRSHSQVQCNGPNGCIQTPQLCMYHMACISRFSSSTSDFFKKWSTSTDRGGQRGPLIEENEASLKQMFTLNGYKNPGVDVWCAIYRAWDHYILGKHTPACSHGPGSPGIFEFASAPRTSYQEVCTHRYQGRIQGVTLAPHLKRPRGSHGGHGAPSPLAAYTASPQETYRSAAAALRDATGPYWVVSDFAVSPRSVQILLEHPREAATVVDLGDLESTLLSKPSWGLRILAELAEDIKDRNLGVSQWEKRNKRPLAKNWWWRPLSDVHPLPIDPESIKPQDPESIMPQAPHSNDPSNRKTHKKGKKRHRNEEDEVVEKKSKTAKHAQDTAEEIPGVSN